MSIKSRIEKLEKSFNIEIHIEIPRPKRIKSLSKDEYDEYRKVFIFDGYLDRQIDYARICGIYRFPKYSIENMDQLVEIANKMEMTFYKVKVFENNYNQKYGIPITSDETIKYNASYYKFIDILIPNKPFDMNKYWDEKEYPENEYPEIMAEIEKIYLAAESENPSDPTPRPD